MRWWPSGFLTLSLESLQPQFPSISKAHCSDRHLHATCHISSPAAGPPCGSSAHHLPLSNCEAKDTAQAGGTSVCSQARGVAWEQKKETHLLPENSSTYTRPKNV